MPTSASACTMFDLAAASVRLALAGALLLSGALKLLRAPTLAPLADALGVVPRRLVAVVGRALPPAEMLLGAWLLVGVWARQALAAASLLFAGFTVILLLLLRRGYHGSCTCFGPVDRHPLGVAQVGRSALLLCAAAVPLVRVGTGACLGRAAWALPATVPLCASIGLLVAAGVYMVTAEIESLHRQFGFGRRASMKGR